MPKAKSKPAPRLKCRFCEFSVPKWSQKRGGKPSSGMNRLLSHIQDDHPEEAAKLFTEEDANGQVHPSEDNF